MRPDCFSSVRNPAIVTTLMVCAVTTWASPLTLPVAAPALKVGESWTYRSVDNWTKQETGQELITFVAQENDQWIFRRQALPNGELSTFILDKNHNSCRSLQNSSTVVCGGPFRFPFAEGWKHAFKDVPWRNGRGVDSADCELKGQEQVEVPAGKFETLKIHCKGFWTRVLEGSGSGRFEIWLWYAPVVKRSVRSEVNDFRSNGQPNDKRLTELVEYKPAP